MFGDDNLLTIKEALEIANVSRYTLYRDIKAGRIPAIYIGRNVRIKESDVLAYAKVKSDSKFVKLYRGGDEKNE